MGRITALSGGTIALQARGKVTQRVTYSSATAFRTRSGTTSSAALKVGDFIAVQGTKTSDGSVTATSIMIGTNPPGHPGTGTGGRPHGAPWSQNGAPGG